LLAQAGQIAGVVNVGVSEKNPVNFLRSYWKGFPVPEAILLETLKESAVYE
jgi:hypothetical protein